MLRIIAGEKQKRLVFDIGNGIVMQVAHELMVHLKISGGVSSVPSYCLRITQAMYPGTVGGGGELSGPKCDE